MSIIKMFVAASGATLATAAIDIPADGVITTMTLGLSVEDAAPASLETVIAELSFVSTPQYTTNDARGSLCQVTRTVFFTDAARIANEGVPFCILTPVAVKVNAGERVFLHCTPEGSQAASAIAYLYIDDGIDVARPQTRRR